ncbi:response regulator [Eubacterium xylanophilum]|uniref:response regulator n=1 Tax=Eubacterium xylanophilum TaxID=39497 RepID=UPI000479528F|nr:response regulator [Eubacterium xylanophilum]
MIEVYYAEDDESIVQSVKEYLERNDAKIVVFKTISEIKSALMNHLPDVVLLDRNMPDRQGSGEWNTDEK